MWARHLIGAVLLMLAVKGFRCQTTEADPQPECELDCLGVGNTPSSVVGFTYRDLCELGCLGQGKAPHGRPSRNPTTGKCECHCFFNYDGRFCEVEPSCFSCSGRCGSLRSGDCTCRCSCGSIMGAKCDRAYCPHLENFDCATNSGGCSDKVVLACPYTCKVPGCIGKRPTCEDDPECHKSAAGCIYRGKRPTSEMCQTLGDNGADVAGVCGKEDVDGGKCGRCHVGFTYDSLFALAYCPVYCGLCPDEGTDNAYTCAPVTSRPPTTTTATTPTTTHMPTSINASIITTKNTPTTSTSMNSVGLTAGLATGVVVLLIIVVVMVILYIRKRSSQAKAPTVDIYEGRTPRITDEGGYEIPDIVRDYEELRDVPNNHATHSTTLVEAGREANGGGETGTVGQRSGHSTDPDSGLGIPVSARNNGDMGTYYSVPEGERNDYLEVIGDGDASYKTGRVNGRERQSAGQYVDMRKNSKAHLSDYENNQENNTETKTSMNCEEGKAGSLKSSDYQNTRSNHTPENYENVQNTSDNRDNTNDDALATPAYQNVTSTNDYENLNRTEGESGTDGYVAMSPQSK